jgi:hypothetical protein
MAKVNKSMFINLFNEKAEEFCKDLVVAFPEVSEFKQLKTGLTLLKTLDEKKPIELFNVYINDDFKTYIMQKDEAFFLKDMDKHIPTSTPIDVSEWHRVISLIRSLWSTLHDDNKETIWKYFQVLIALNDKCV